MCDYDRERKSVHGYMVLANQSVLFQCFSLAMLKLFHIIFEASVSI